MAHAAMRSLEIRSSETEPGNEPAAGSWLDRIRRRERTGTGLRARGGTG